MSNKKTKPFVIAIVGPTAIGKSAYAVALAKKIKGEIISADSRQIYRGLDIGSGKVQRDQKHNVQRITHNENKKKENSKDYGLLTTDYFHSGVPHHMLDVASPKKV